MSRVAFICDPSFWEHDPGRNHPERPGRLDAVRTGVALADLDEELVVVDPRDATDAELHRTHSPSLVDAIEELCANGGGRIDADTISSARSSVAARRAAGAGLTAIETLTSGAADAAFCAVRPPGHHATPTRAMGFCLYNNVAVTAAALAADGHRVAIVDIDAHHGNGTQDAFHDDDRVLYVSWHQSPMYPGTGPVDDVGGAAARGSTVNLPLPAGATGDVYCDSFERMVGPAIEAFAPEWLLISAGFDAHHRDPLTDLGLSAGDYLRLVGDLVALAPAPGRTVAFLEGGYDLEAVTSCTATTLSALARRPLATERPTTGGPGREVVELAMAHHLG